MLTFQDGPISSLAPDPPQLFLTISDRCVGIIKSKALEANARSNSDSTSSKLNNLLCKRRLLYHFPSAQTQIVT